MTRELSPHARSILERYKEVEAIPPAERSRLLASVLDAAARGVPPKFGLSHAASVAPRPTLAARLWATPLSKPIIASVFLALPTLAAVGLAQRTEVPNLPASPSEGPARRALPAPVVSEPELPENAVPAKPSVAPFDSAKHAARSFGTRPGDAASSATIDGELRLLKQAQAAQQSGDSRRALTLLDEYALRFPSGRLADVRAVARLVALCQLGQASLARQEAARFQVRYPNSPFNDRVRGICAAKTSP